MPEPERSGTARNGLPGFRPYVAGERAAFREPPAVTAARERHRARTEEIERAADEAQERQREGGGRAVTKGRWPGADGDERSLMARVSDARPFKPYAYGGTGEDIYHGVVGYLEDVRRPGRAVTRHEESMPDGAPGPEWYRERAAEDEDPPQMAWDEVPPRAPGDGTATFVPDEPELRTPAPALALAAADGDELAELDAARDRYQEVMTLAGPPEPRPAPPPVTAARRCRRCGYLKKSAGCRVACDG